MYRFHKRDLKWRRMHRHLNFNKDKNNPHNDEFRHGTGNRERSYYDHCRSREEAYALRCVHEDFDKKCLWETPLTTHMECPLHDRTRWKSSVDKTKTRNRDRVLKQGDQEEPGCRRESE